MPEYLDDPSVLTKERLKNELLAHNVELPGGNPTKDVYVQLYLKNLTAQNQRHGADLALDAFSSDEELPPPVVSVSRRSRASGRKSVAVLTVVEGLDVTGLTDQGLRDQLLKHGVDVGPIVATTRKLYEKKLQKLLDNGPVITEHQVNHNGGDTEMYSDREDEVAVAPEPAPVPEPEPEPEPVPVLEEPVRSRGKTSSRTNSSSRHTTQRDPVEDRGATEEALKSSRRSKRLSHRMYPEALGPLTTEHTKESHQSPIWGPPPSSSRPASFPVAPALSKPIPAPVAPAQEQAVVKVPSLDPLAFISKCNISPIKKPSVSAQGKASTAGVEKITAEEPPKEDPVLKDPPTSLNGSGLNATCRRPIKGAATRPVILSDQHHQSTTQNYYTSKTTSTSLSSFTETRNRVSSAAISNTNSAPIPNLSIPATSRSGSSHFKSSTIASTTPATPACRPKAKGMSWWKKLLLLAILGVFLLFIYQAMETNDTNPFEEIEAVPASVGAA